MRLPIEIAIGIFGLAVSIVWAAMHFEASPVRRASLVVVALGLMMFAISGRMEPASGATILDFIFEGGAFIVAGTAVLACTSIHRLVRRWLKRRERSRM